MTLPGAQLPVLSEADKRLKPARRREQVRPVPGEPLALDRPEVKEVMDTETGRHLSVSAVMGTDYEKLMQLRMTVRTQMQKGEPLYRCSLCCVAVHICRAPDKPKFFFRHQHEDGSCPAQTKGELSEDEIDARKYNGAKESLLHRRMKEWVYQCLERDERFQDISQEQTWKGVLTGAFADEYSMSLLPSSEILAIATASAVAKQAGRHMRQMLRSVERISVY